MKFKTKLFSALFFSLIFLNINNISLAEEENTKIAGKNINAFSRGGIQTSIGGYFDTEFYIPDGKNSFFDQHRLILQASSIINDRIFFNSEIEFEHGGIIGGGTNDGELQIEQAYLDYKIEDWMVLRGGAFLVPLGRLNILHDSDYRDTTARPLFNRVIIPTTWTETGIGFHGNFLPNDSMELNYELYLSQGLTDKIADGNGLRDARPSLSAETNSGKAISGRVGVSPFLGLDLGLGGYYTPYDEKSQKNLGLIAGDFKYSLGAFEILGEAGFAGFDPVVKTDKDGKTTTLGGGMWGYYLEAHYKFFPEFLKFSFLGKDFDKPVFTLFSRVDQVDTDISKLNENDRTQLCFGFNYRPVPNAAFKLEYQWNIENEAVLKGDYSKEKANNQFIASIAVGF